MIAAPLLMCRNVARRPAWSTGCSGPNTAIESIATQRHPRPAEIPNPIDRSVSFVLCAGRKHCDMSDPAKAAEEARERALRARERAAQAGARAEEAERRLLAAAHRRRRGDEDAREPEDRS
jgi:hypothetical protein